MDLKKKLFCEAWLKTFGNITHTCQLVGVSRQTYYDWMNEDPEFKKIIDNSDPLEIKLDFIENKIIERINKGSDAVLIMAAKTIGKKRGYYEKTESEVYGKDGKPIVTETHVKIIRDKTSGTTPVNSASESAEGD
jgi:hypothetical protein